MIVGTVASPLVLAAAGQEAGPSRSLRVDDREAVLACQRGEREAFDRLVVRYQRDVYRLCYRYVNNHHDANDMAQEAFLRAYKAIEKFRGDSSFSTWLYRIAVNTCLNFRSSRRANHEELSESLADGGAFVTDRLEREETSQRVREAVSSLPDKQRATVILKVYHELTHEEVALILGCTVGTVKANLFHALGNLRKRLRAKGARS